MKKNAIKFWVKNRFTAMVLAWVLGFALMCEVDNPYFNGWLISVLFLSTLFGGTYLVEENKMNSSERLMWQKYSTLFDEE